MLPAPHTLIHTFAKYSTEAYKTFPQMTLHVSGTDVTFLVDSGATHSVIRAREMPDVDLSGKFVFSLGSSGTTNMFF